RDGHFPWPLSRKLFFTEGDYTKHSADLQIHPADRESRLSAGPPHHGAGAIELVPALRPQPANLRTQHFLRQTAGLRESHAARLPRRRRRQLNRPPRRPHEVATELTERLVGAWHCRARLFACQDPLVIPNPFAPSRTA